MTESNEPRGGAGPGPDEPRSTWDPPTGGWSDRVAFSDDGGGFAYRPHELLVINNGEAVTMLERFGVTGEQRDAVIGSFVRYRRVPEPIRLSRRLNRLGVPAQLNHVFFVADDPCCCRPHPSLAGQPGGTASPVYASPVYASPVYASPVYASPVYASPVYASQADLLRYRLTGQRRSSATPATDDEVARCTARFVAPPALKAPHVVVIDTGLALGNDQPPILANAGIVGDPDGPDQDGDHLLDPAAGHGTFIAGLICQIAPGCQIELRHAVEPAGDVDEGTLAALLGQLVGQHVAIVNLSISGYTLTDPMVLAEAVEDVQADGAVVVASAGNDASCRPTYPAALPGVIGVGAIGPTGPAPFTNYGPWVRACAPGVDLTSTFFTGFDGLEQAPPGGADPDCFAGFATWSGTSFSAPIVAAAIAQAMQREPALTPDAASARVIDAPGLLRITDLGTVVNTI